MIKDKGIVEHFCRIRFGAKGIRVSENYCFLLLMQMAQEQDNE